MQKQTKLSIFHTKKEDHAKHAQKYRELCKSMQSMQNYANGAKI